MKPEFTNVTVMNKDMCVAFLKLFWRKQSGWIRWAMFAIAAVSFGFGLYQFLLFGFAALGRFIGMAIIAGLALWLALFGYNLRKKEFIRGVTESWGGSDSIRKALSFHDEYIEEATEQNGHRKFYYKDVEAILEDKRIIVLRLKNNGGSLLIERAGFPGGQEEAAKCLAFLKQKSPVKP